ncbi:MAG: hypothetical protein HY978_03385 [Candidatus Liptonbacteria bacterium]|nr:hypothetical protein [Candidatus Liptonbacteria bacterium]
MTEAVATKNLNKTAAELEELVRRSRRKLLELEVALSRAEIARGKSKTYRSASALLRTAR